MALDRHVQNMKHKRQNTRKQNTGHGPQPSRRLRGRRVGQRRRAAEKKALRLDDVRGVVDGHPAVELPDVARVVGVVDARQEAAGRRRPRVAADHRRAQRRHPINTAGRQGEPRPRRRETPRSRAPPHGSVAARGRPPQGAGARRAPRRRRLAQGGREAPGRGRAPRGVGGGRVARFGTGSRNGLARGRDLGRARGGFGKTRGLRARERFG